MRRRPCRHGKAASRAASIQDPFLSPLMPTRKARAARMISGATVSRSFSLMSQSGMRSPSSEFTPVSQDWITVGSFGEHPDQLERKLQTLLVIPVEFASLHSPINGAHVSDTAYVRGELAANNAEELLCDLRHSRFVPAGDLPDLINHSRLVL